MTRDIIRLFPTYPRIFGLIGQSRRRGERGTGRFDYCGYFQYDVLSDGSEFCPITRFAIGEQLQFESRAGKACYPHSRGPGFDRGMFVQHHLHTVQHEPQLVDFCFNA